MIVPATCVTVSLFAEPSVAPRTHTSLALSIFAHGLAAAVVYFALTHLPRIQDRNPAEHYTIRQLDLRNLDPGFPELPTEAKRRIPYPRFSTQSPAGDLPPDLAEAMRSFLLSIAGRQTLIQSDVRTRLPFSEQVPIANILIWTPGEMPRKKIVAPRPISDVSSYVTPSLELPNTEIYLSNIAVKSTELPSRNIAIQASTTSPIESSTVKPVQTPLVTVAPSGEQPTPATVLSISSVKMEEGTLFLPPVNDIAKSTAPALARKPQSGDGSGSGYGAGETGPASAEAASLDDSQNITTDGRRLSAEHILVPKDGRFKVIMVGNSVAEDYPETAELWANRVAYTTYLHLGLKENWILQYSFARSGKIAVAGNVARLEAPWPYDIMRPNLLSRDLNANALMVHAVLNPAGRFESLAIVFPRNFRYATFLLQTLRQWQFRPARQNGQATPVEVLLIIPDELQY